MGHENAGGSSRSSAPDPQLCLVARVPLPSMPHSGEQVSLTALVQHGSVCRPHGLVERCPLANGRPAKKKKIAGKGPPGRFGVGGRQKAAD